MANFRREATVIDIRSRWLGFAVLLSVPCIRKPCVLRTAAAASAKIWEGDFDASSVRAEVVEAPAADGEEAPLDPQPAIATPDRHTIAKPAEQRRFRSLDASFKIIQA